MGKREQLEMMDHAALHDDSDSVKGFSSDDGDEEQDDIIAMSDAKT
jgi:hypothetical protein